MVQVPLSTPGPAGFISGTGCLKANKGTLARAFTESIGVSDDNNDIVGIITVLEEDVGHTRLGWGRLRYAVGSMTGLAAVVVGYIPLPLMGF